MFDSGMREAENRKVEVVDLSPPTFLDLLYYIYSGSLHQSPTFASSLSLLKAADRLEV
jgi:hypothetical protein